MNNQYFDIDKVLQVILYVANKVDRKDIHQVFKMLYFADREHLLKYGRTITGDTYVKMNNGPVPSKIYDIIKTARGDSAFSFVQEISKKIKECFAVNGRDIVPFNPANLDYLSKTDIVEIDNAVSKYGQLSFTELTNVSHGSAWNASDRIIKQEDILREADPQCSEEYIEYLNDLTTAESFLLNGC